MDYKECSELGCTNHVFARGICRKHYEQVRLETAAPCSFEGCTAPSYRGDLCSTHYRLFTLSKRPKCIIPGCNDPQHSLSKGLCNKHDFRMRRHGHAEQTRQVDWGARESHPLYSSWVWHKRRGAAGMCDEWRNNFWAFVEAVQARPANHHLLKLDIHKPIGPGNWHWSEKIQSADKAARQREWRKRNIEKATGYDLKRRFGLSIAQYEAMADTQNGVCAICKQPERSLDKDGGPRRMPVDHCHTTGKVRGLLCTACNRALGLFKDSPDILASAISYLNNSLDTSLQTK